jgi:hypothetical protein
MPPHDPARTPAGRARRAAALAVLPALVAGALATTTAPASAETVTTVFRVTFSTKVTYDHKRYWGENVSDDDHLSYELTGPVGTATFEDGVLRAAAVSPITRRVVPKLSATHTNGDGTSASCSGDAATIRGMAVLRRDGSGHAWFAPLFGAEVAAQCRDSDGGTSTGTRTFAAVSGGPVQGVTSIVPNWAFAFPMTRALADREEFEVPYDLTVKSRYCPDYDLASTTSCTLRVQGEVTFIRQSRTVEPDPFDVLDADVAQRPKLDVKRRKASTTVRCGTGRCSIDIEVFGPPRRTAPMPAFKRRRVTGRAGRATTVAVPLTAAQTKAIAQGGGFAKVTIARAGKQASAVYPLGG